MSNLVFSPETSPRVILQSDYLIDVPEWNYELLKFKVGDQYLLSVPSHWFKGSKGVFRQLIDAWNKEAPISLPDVSLEDFRAFLTLLSPSADHSLGDIEYEAWLGALRLANKWKFGAVRARAIQHMNAFVKDATPDVQISYGKQYLVQDWLRDGLQALIDDRTLTVEDLARPPYAFLHSDIARILYVQKEAAMKAWTCTNPSVGPAHRYRKHAAALLEEVFKVDLDAAVYVEHVPSPSSGKVKQTPRKGTSFSPYGFSASRRDSGTTPRSARKVQ